MDMSGTQLIAASRVAVWEALNDPEVLRACIPGCRELTKTSDTEMTAVAVVKVGPIGARFQGAVTLSDLDPPNSYTITGEGQGGVAGFAKGVARVRLESAQGGTLLHYTVEAQIGGKLAQLGARLIDATARKMSGQFFARFSQETQARQQAVAGTELQVDTPHEPGTPAHIRQSASVQRQPGAEEVSRYVREPRKTDGGLTGTFTFLNLLAAGVIGAAVVALWLRYGATLPGLVPAPDTAADGRAYVSPEFAGAVQLVTAAAIGYLYGRLRQRR